MNDECLLDFFTSFPSSSSCSSSYNIFSLLLSYRLKSFSYSMLYHLSFTCCFSNFLFLSYNSSAFCFSLDLLIHPFLILSFLYIPFYSSFMIHVLTPHNSFIYLAFCPAPLSYYLISLNPFHFSFISLDISS